MLSLLILVHPNMVYEYDRVSPQTYWDQIPKYMNTFDYVIVTMLDMNIPAGKHQQGKDNFVSYIESERDNRIAVVYENQSGAGFGSPEFKRVFIPFLMNKTEERIVYFSGGIRGNCLEETKREFTRRFQTFIRDVKLQDFEPLIYGDKGDDINLVDLLFSEKK